MWSYMIIRNEHGTPILVSWGFVCLVASDILGQVRPTTWHRKWWSAASTVCSWNTKNEKMWGMGDVSILFGLGITNPEIIQRFASWTNPCRTVMFQPRGHFKILKISRHQAQPWTCGPWVLPASFSHLFQPVVTLTWPNFRCCRCCGLHSPAAFPFFMYYFSSRLNMVGLIPVSVARCSPLRVLDWAPWRSHIMPHPLFCRGNCGMWYAEVDALAKGWWQKEALARQEGHAHVAQALHLDRLGTSWMHLDLCLLQT